jgi:hypothetical protein
MNALVAVALTLILTTHSFGQQSEFFVTERGPHHATWRHVVQAAESEHPRTITNSFVQLEDGLNVFSATEGAWIPASDEIEIINGNGVSRKAQHKVIFASSLTDANGVIDLSMPDGKRVRIRPLGLAFTDSATGDSLFIDEVRSAALEKSAVNQVIYPNAFIFIPATVRYTVTRNGLEQDIMIQGRVPSPEQFGFASATTSLEVWNEVLEAAEPVKIPRAIRRENGATEVDEQLDFGAMFFPQGKSFSTPRRPDGSKEDAIAKEWIQIEGRTYLIEKVPWTTAADEIAMLPEGDSPVAIDKAVLQKAFASHKSSSRARPLASKTWASLSSERRRLATRDRSIASQTAARPAYIFDFITLNSGQVNFVAKGDTTYYVSGAVSCTGSSATFEGGAVFKFAQTSSAGITVSASSVLWQASAYRPVVFTAQRDLSVGQNVGGTGGISGYYGGTYLAFSGSAVQLHNARFVSAAAALSLPAVAGSSITHVQFVNCNDAVRPNGSDFSLRNCLFDNTVNVLAGTPSAAAIARLEHTTIDTATWFNQTVSSQSAVGAIYLTNSILAAVQNKGFTGAVPSDCLDASSPAGLFATQGGGAHYLANASPYRNNTSGKLSINPGLLSDLRKMTTYAPALLTGSIPASTVMYPSVILDSDSDGLDTGYHYWPIDYIWSSLNVTNATLTLTNGVSVAGTGTPMLYLRTSSSKIVSQGRPERLNRITSYNTIQERALNSIAAPSVFRGFPTTLDLTFTDVSLVAGGGLIFDDFYRGTVCVTNSSLRGVTVGAMAMDVAYTPKLYLKNNILQNCTMSVDQGYNVNSSFYGNFLELQIYNNLFTRCGGAFKHFDSNPYGAWNIYDNLFDGCTFTFQEVTTPVTAYSADYNGFVGGSFLTGSHNFANRAADFVSGPLGPYYYPASGSAPSLASLKDQGSRTAAAAGLAQFTSQGPKDSGQVDIGFHYATSEEIWIEDAIPSAAIITDPTSEAANWIWSYTPTPVDNVGRSFRSPGTSSGYHLQYFYSAYAVMNVRAGDTLFGYVFINPQNIPSEIMFQWHAVGSADWNRAYWGVNNAYPNWLGTDGTPNKRGMGSLPSAGAWIRLEVPASLVDLEGKTVDGFGFTLWGGQVNFDKIGRAPAAWLDTDRDGLADYLEDTDGDAIVDTGETSLTTPDTDGDGLVDGSEVVLGYNPLKPKGSDTANTIAITILTPVKD